jgi:hypothetical protein
MNTYHPKIATGDEAKAIRLYEFVNFYKPSHWVVPIHNVVFTPMFLAQDIPSIEKDPEAYCKQHNYHWYILEAIQAFLKGKNHDS